MISINAEKTLQQIQHSFMTKVLKKLEIEGKYINIIKAIYNKPTVNITLNGGKIQTISSKVRNKTRVPLSPLLFNSLGIPS
jgi:hypothetical protein